MMLRPQRLESLLSKDGFNLSWIDDVEKGCEFVRNSSIPGLFEGVHAGSAGARGEALVGYVWVGAVRRRFAWGLKERQLLIELARVPGRGHTLVQNQQETMEWEVRLALIAADRAAEIAQRKGPALLERTQEARAAADEYIRKLNGFPSPDDLRSRLTPSQVAEFERIINVPGVWSFDCFRECVIAVMAILLFSSEIDNGLLDKIENPLDNTQFMWRITLIADRLVNLQQGQPPAVA